MSLFPNTFRTFSIILFFSCAIFAQEPLKVCGGSNADLNAIIAKATKGIAFSSRNYDAYVERGEAYEEKNEFELALKDFNTAINLAPLRDDAYFSRGHLYERRSNKKLAFADFSRAIELNPSNGMA